MKRNFLKKLLTAIMTAGLVITSLTPLVGNGTTTADAALAGTQYLRYVEKNRISSDELMATEIESVIKTSCAEVDVYDRLKHDSHKHVAVRWDSKGIHAKSPFTREVKFNLGNDMKKKPKSMKYRKKVLTVYYLVKPANGTVTITSKWTKKK